MPFQKGNKLGKFGGRKKASHTIQAEKAREYLIQRVTEELEPILNKLIAKAKEGDIAAIKDLLDRAYGRATETIQHKGLEFLFDEEEDTMENVVGEVEQLPAETKGS